jgi:hypothetical protein
MIRSKPVGPVTYTQSSGADVWPSVIPHRSGIYEEVGPRGDRAGGKADHATTSKPVPPVRGQKGRRLETR